MKDLLDLNTGRYTMYILSATNKLQEGETHLWILGHGVRDLGLGDTVGLLGVIFLSLTLSPKPVNTDHRSIVFSFLSCSVLDVWYLVSRV